MEHLLKIKKEYKNLQKQEIQGNTRFRHKMAYADFMDLPRKTASQKISRDKAIDIAKNPKHDGYQCGFASIAYRFLIETLLLTKKKELIRMQFLKKNSIFIMCY